MTRASPPTAGFSGVTRLLSACTTHGTLPHAKRPGDALLTFTLMMLLGVPFTGEPSAVPLVVGPFTITANGAVPSPRPSSQGICKLIWPGETNNSGAGKP